MFPCYRGEGDIDIVDLAVAGYAIESDQALGRVRLRVITDLISFSEGALDQFWMQRHVGANVEKGGVNACLLEDV